MFCSAPLGSCRTAGTLIQYSVTCSSPSTSPTLLLLNMNYIFILHKRTYYYWSLSCLSLVFLILDTLAVFLLYLDTDHAQLRFLWHHIDENQHCLPPSLIAPPILFFPALSSYISWICPMMHCSLPADGCRWKSSEIYSERRRGEGVRGWGGRRWVTAVVWTWTFIILQAAQSAHKPLPYLSNGQCSPSANVHLYSVCFFYDALTQLRPLVCCVQHHTKTC